LDKLKEILIGKLEFENPNDRLDYLVNLINDKIKPPKRLTTGDVNVRAIYLANDLVNSHGGCFTESELIKLTELIVDTPVLIGHDRSSAPLARTFHAEILNHDDVLWLKSYFYWPKAVESSHDEFLKMIDSGVYKECSIAFSYEFPECSKCGKDIRSCPHDIGTDNHFYYTGINQVLETSVVYKGSVKGTFITDKLSKPADHIVLSYEDNGAIRKVTVNPHQTENRQIEVLDLELIENNLPRIIARPDYIKCAPAVKNSNVFLLAKHD
jgi:hypothetical protein